MPHPPTSDFENELCQHQENIEDLLKRIEVLLQEIEDVLVAMPGPPD